MSNSIAGLGSIGAIGDLPKLSPLAPADAGGGLVAFYRMRFSRLIN